MDEEAGRDKVRNDLPRNGSQLRYVVQVLPRTSDEDKRDNLKHFIHQAKVRRGRVIDVFLGMKRLGHRAYVNVDEEAVLKNAKRLPENGVPPELITLLANDSGFGKLRMQKAATPCVIVVATQLVAVGKPLVSIWDRESMHPTCGARGGWRCFVLSWCCFFLLLCFELT